MEAKVVEASISDGEAEASSYLLPVGYPPKVSANKMQAFLLSLCLSCGGQCEHLQLHLLFNCKLGQAAGTQVFGSFALPGVMPVK